MKAHSKAATRDCDIIACYISLPVGSLSDPKALATVTYLDEPALEDFLMGSGSDSAVRQPIPSSSAAAQSRWGCAQGDGILQKFVASSGEKHTVYRAVWSPYTFTLESRTNHHNLIVDPVRPTTMAERAVTFDGGEHCSTHRMQTTNAYIQQPIHRAVERVVHHVNGLMPKGFRAGRATMYLKIVRKKKSTRVMLLYCSSLQVVQVPEDEEPDSPAGGQAKPAVGEGRRRHEPAPFRSLEEALQHTDRVVKQYVPRGAPRSVALGSWDENGRALKSNSIASSESWRSSRFSATARTYTTSAGPQYSSSSYSTRSMAPPAPLAPRPPTPTLSEPVPPPEKLTAKGERAPPKPRRAAIVNAAVLDDGNTFQCSSCNGVFTDEQRCEVSCRCIVTHFKRLEEETSRRTALRAKQQRKGALSSRGVAGEAGAARGALGMSASKRTLIRAASKVVIDSADGGAEKENKAQAVGWTAAASGLAHTVEDEDPFEAKHIEMAQQKLKEEQADKQEGFAKEGACTHFLTCSQTLVAYRECALGPFSGACCCLTDPKGPTKAARTRRPKSALLAIVRQL